MKFIQSKCLAKTPSFAIFGLFFCLTSIGAHQTWANSPHAPIKSAADKSYIDNWALVAGSVRAFALEPTLEEKLYNFVIRTQIEKSANLHLIGAWPVMSKIMGTFLNQPEANSFVTLQLLLALRDVANHRELPYFADVAYRAGHQIRLFLFDAEFTQEPRGTLNYWPIIDYQTGRRGVSRKAPFRWLDLFNIPNDFDSSSQAYLWFHAINDQSEFRNAFVHTVGQFTDKARTEQYPNDNAWKNLNSGAILTWAEPDANEEQGIDSRIFGGIGDVDCIVNLNVLSALGTHQQSNPLPSHTEQAMLHSCQVINQAVAGGHIPACSVWYDRPSQFFLSYSKALRSGLTCLSDSQDTAGTSLLAHARYLLDRNQIAQGGELAEVIIAIKKIFLPAYRHPYVTSLLGELQNLLLSTVTTTDDVAYVHTADSLYKADYKGVKLEWFSQPFTTALALEAIVLP